MTRLTELQRRGLKKLAKQEPGTWHSFGYGFGRFRIALRALHHRAGGLVMYEARDGDEFFCITGEGRHAVLTSPDNPLK